MRKRFVLIALSLLALFTLLLLQRHEDQMIAPQQRQAALTNEPKQSKRSSIVEQPQTTGAMATAAIPSSAVKSNATLANSNSGQMARLLGVWQTPIEFYGKVVDENSNAVKGAKVKFQWVEMPSEEGNRTSITESDSEGLFSLHGQRGPDLMVAVSKEGYYASHRGQQGFKYGPFGNPGFSADPQNPIIFYLRKKGSPEPLIKTDFPVGIGQIAQLRHDGTPVGIDLLQAQQVSVGSGQLQLEFWRDIADINPNTFDWKCRLTVPGGGLIETAEEFAFQAPEGGYQPAVLIDMRATNQNWQGEIRSKYYIHFPDGRYGRVDFYFLSFNGVYTVQSVCNPTGSRNLEPAD